jgi:hypothetical protein
MVRALHQILGCQIEEDIMAVHVACTEPRREMPTGSDIRMENVARCRRLHASDYMVLMTGQRHTMSLWIGFS